VKQLSLFILRRGKKGDPLRDDDHSLITFSNKEDAKALRNKLGENYVVSYGPDHHKTLNRTGV
jgi:hypothetical protein